MTHFLDTLPFDFSNPGAQALLELLHNTYSRQKDVMVIVTEAGISPGVIHWEQPAYHLWYDVLAHAARQGKARALVEEARKHPFGGRAITTRLDEIVRAAPVVEAAPGRRARDFVWRGSNEALTGERDTMLDVSFLRLGAERARAVVRLLCRWGKTQKWGTGFLVQPDLVLTNHHVLHSGPNEDAPPDAVEVWFHYEIEPGGGEREKHIVPGRCDTITGDPALDWAVVRLGAGAPADAVPLTLGAAKPIGLEDRVYIIQHPAGGPKKVGLHHNEVRYLDGDVIQYLTDTKAGSSGAPVFNDQWEVVALHYRSVGVLTAAGTEEARNQGIRIERVVEGLGHLLNTGAA